MSIQPVLIAGQWREASLNANTTGTFRAEDPTQCKALDEVYPISDWTEIDAALAAAHEATGLMRAASREQIANFLESYADRIERASQELVALAHAETALPVEPRLAQVELPRTTAQLREAARAAREGSWRTATIDTKLGIRSWHSPHGPVIVFGPNNFPFAFNSVAGGDFAAAIATGNPVIAKANTSHPGTTRLLAVAAHEAVRETKLPPAAVQLIYRTSHEDGERLVADPRTASTAYTGSRSAGLVLKAAADRAGKPIYLELSSVNPVVVLPGALVSRGAQIADEFAGSCLMGTGQFCTNPGLALLLAGDPTDRFIDAVIAKFQGAAIGTLLSRGVAASLEANLKRLTDGGAKLLAGGTPGGGRGYSFANTLHAISGARFLQDPALFQTETFGNASLFVVAEDMAQAAAVLESLEGNLTGCLYSDAAGSDDRLYEQLAPILRRKVGRLLNDKMPTGVAVSAAMNHGGPYPATGHAGFTAVGIPASLRRFTALECYDNVRAHRLPPELQDKNPNGVMWRLIDGQWSQGDVTSK